MGTGNFGNLKNQKVAKIPRPHWHMDLGEYYYHDDKFDEEYDNKNPSVEFKNKVLEFKIKNNRKIIRAVSLHEKQNFLAKPSGKIRLGLVTRIPSKKKLK